MSDRITQFSTKKAARDAGLRTYEEWLKSERNYQGEYRRPMVPRRDGVPFVVKGSEFYAIEDCEVVISRTEAGRRGLVVPKDASRVTVRYTQCHGVGQHYEVFRISDCVPKRR